jgi:hypothetical protein
LPLVLVLLFQYYIIKKINRFYYKKKKTVTGLYEEMFFKGAIGFAKYFGNRSNVAW